jgi:hypothetical protein
MKSMDPFVRRLVERLHDPGSPLSRNRHFHAFENPQGRAALKISKRLRALQADIAKCQAEGSRTVARTRRDAEGKVRMEIELKRLHARRVTQLDQAEFELLCRLPGVSEAVVKED